MLVELVRFIFVLVSVSVAFQLGEARPEMIPGASPEAGALIVTGIGAGLGYVFGGALARALDRLLNRAERGVAARHASEVLASTLGLVIGLVLGALVSWPLLVTLPPRYAYLSSALLIVTATSFCMRVAVRKRVELFGVLGVVPSGGAEAATGCLLDASAAIDGRILAMWKAGLVASPIWVPTFILWELQGIADSSDPQRRRRGKRGLDVLTSLREAGCVVRVLDEDPAGTSEPDAKLVVVARRRGLALVTSDSNLAKAAELQGVRVLNPHALAEILRPPVLPGERTRVRLVKEGREPGQAVGYLDDGTMVVVERAASSLGEDVEVEVTSVHRTGSGRMLFSRPAQADGTFAIVQPDARRA